MSRGYSFSLPVAFAKLSAMKPGFLFVTGTDTDVGKTVLAALLTRALRAGGVEAVALKPIGAGGREDARQLWLAGEKMLSLDQVNPWHFKTPLAPTLSARREGKRVRLAQVANQILGVSKKFETVVVEGAGGLLSPMGEEFDSRDLIARLHARVVVVAPNRLGVVGQVRLVLAALPPKIARSAQVLLVDQAKPDNSAKTNAKLLAEFVPEARIHALPWFERPAAVKLTPKLSRQLCWIAGY